MLNNSVKDFLANPVYINTYRIKKIASWHLGSAYVVKDGNDQADTRLNFQHIAKVRNTF
jgi:hypothetical protein